MKHQPESCHVCLFAFLFCFFFKKMAGIQHIKDIVTTNISKSFEKIALIIRDQETLANFLFNEETCFSGSINESKFWKTILPDPTA